MATASQVLAKARSQIGTHEKGSTNSVKYNDAFYGGKYPKAYQSWAAWCSVFTGWCSEQLGMRPNVDYPRSAGVAICFQWFREHDRIVSKHKLNPGDWVRFTFSHTALVEKVLSGGRIQTIEGNTSPGNGGSQRDGGGVHRRIRSLSLIQYGGRPRYGAAATTPSASAGGDDMTIKNVGNYTGNLTLPKGKWKTIPINAKGDQTLVSGIKKGDNLQALSSLTLTGLPKGAEAAVRFFLVSYKKGTTTQRVYTYPTTEIVGTAGQTFGQAAFMDHIGKVGKHDTRLRAEVLVHRAGVHLTKATQKVGK